VDKKIISDLENRIIQLILSNVNLSSQFIKDNKRLGFNYLRRVLHDKRPLVRLLAAWKLRRLGLKKVESLLIRAFKREKVLAIKATLKEILPPDYQIRNKAAIEGALAGYSEKEKDLKRLLVEAGVKDYNLFYEDADELIAKRAEIKGPY